jgi:hypothetical protein
MIKKLFYLGLFVSLILFVQCKKEPLQTQVTVQNLSDFESNDGSIHIKITGGKKPYHVEWSVSGYDTINRNLQAGTYFATITDARQNTHIDTIKVTQPAWPVCIDAQGISYKTRLVGGQIWMIENLRTRITKKGDSIPYYAMVDSINYINEYGLLYTWSAAMNHSLIEEAQGICPDGWHIPSDSEWNALIDNISTVDKEIPNLVKELSLTFPGFYNNGFQNSESSVSFWTSSQAGNNAYKRYFNKSLSKAYRYHENKQNAISVRCVKNNKAGI